MVVWLWCALSGFGAPGGRCCLAPVRVPWLWPAACRSGVPRGPAWCAAPHPVRSLSVLRSAFPTPWCLSPSRGLSPPDLLGGCAGHAEAGRESGSLCLPLAPAEAGALGSLRVVPVRGPAMGLSLAGPSGVGLGLRALRWLARVDPVTDASGFPYRPSFDRGTRPVHRGCFVWTPTPPLAGRWMPRPGPVRVCVCSSFLAGSGGPASRARFGAPHLFLWPLCLSALLGPLPAGVAPFLVLCWPSPCFPPPLFLFLLRAPPFVSCFLWFPAPGALGLGALFFFPPPRPVVFLFCAPSISGFLSFLAPGALGLGAACCLFCWPPASRLSVLSRLVCVSRPAVGCSLVVAAPPPPPFRVSRFSSLPFGARFFFVVRPRCLWLSLVPGLGCPGPWCCWFFLCGPSASLLSPALSPLLCVPPRRWLLSGGCCPPPPPAPFFVFFFALSFLRCLCPRCLWLSLVSSPGCPWPWRCVLFVLVASRFSARCALSPLLCSRLALGCTLVVPVPPPPPLCVSRFSSHPPGPGIFFFFSFFFRAPPCLPLSLVSGPGCPGPWRCVLFVLLASRFSARCALSPLLCFHLAVGCSLVVAPPPPSPFVSRGFRRCLSVLVVFFFRCAPP